MLWNVIQYLVFSEKKMPSWDVIGCTLFEDLKRRRHLDFTSTWNHIDEDYQVVRFEDDSYNWNYSLKEVIRTNIWIYLVSWDYII